MGFTIEEQIWFGGSYQHTTLEGTNTQIHASGSEWAKHAPQKRVWHSHITASPGATDPKTYIFPDARTLPTGGPLWHFLVTGEPGVTQVRFVDNTYSGFFWTVSVPISIKFYLVDNSFEVGLWAWKSSGFFVGIQSASALIASFGSSPNTGAIDKYNFVGDVWSTESDSGNDWFRCGVSYSGPRALIRTGGTIWSHTSGTTSFETNLGFANVRRCSFIRASGQAIGSRHYGLGNYDGGSAINDYWERVPNAFTVFGTHVATGWLEGSSAAVTNGQSVNYHILQTIAYFQQPYAHPSWLWFITSGVWVVAQPLDGHEHWAPSVSLGSVHVLGGASYRSNLFDTATRWNHRYSATFSGWLHKPWIPNPLHGHGARELPSKFVSSRCLFSMGKDHSFFPSNNVNAWRYDSFVDTYTVVSSDTWTDRQEQETSWGHVD